MKFKLLVFTSILIILSLSCSLLNANKLRKETEEGTEESAELTDADTEIPIKFISFGYEHKEDYFNDGWNIGYIRLALENVSEDPYVGPLNLSQGAIIYTKEGAEYEPIEYWAAGVHRDTTVLPNTDTPFISLPGPLPPGFRFYALKLQWRYAETTTPERIYFPDFPELSVSIPSETNTSIEFPFDMDSPPTRISSFSSLNGKEITTDNENITLRLTGRCGDQIYLGMAERLNVHLHSAGIELEVVNNDKFYDQAFGVPVGLSVFDRDTNKIGLFCYDQLYTSSIGPGLSETRYRDLGSCSVWGDGWYKDRAPIVVLWYDNNNYEVLDASECIRVEEKEDTDEIVFNP